MVEEAQDPHSNLSSETDLEILTMLSCVGSSALFFARTVFAFPNPGRNKHRAPHLNSSFVLPSPSFDALLLMFLSQVSSPVPSSLSDTASKSIDGGEDALPSPHDLLLLRSFSMMLRLAMKFGVASPSSGDVRLPECLHLAPVRGDDVTEFGRLWLERLGYDGTGG